MNEKQKDPKCTPHPEQKKYEQMKFSLEVWQRSLAPALIILCCNVPSNRVATNRQKKGQTDGWIDSSNDIWTDRNTDGLFFVYTEG